MSSAHSKTLNQLKTKKRQKLLMTSLFALTSLFASGSSFAETAEHRIITLQAETSREVQNDQMQATLYTELNNTNPTVLAKESAQIINRAMDLAKTYSTVRVSNGTQSTYPIYNDKNKLTGWRGRTEIQLKTTDFKAGSELIAQLQSSMQLEAVNFTVSTDQRLKVENELLTEITKIFQKNAAQVQQAWGASKYELVNMNISNSNDQPRPYAMMMRAAKFEASDAVPAQTVQSGNSLIRTVANGSIQLQ
ncbi:MAG TPA: SIMPL domain-containing protein [Aquirhabdus sp.]